jgi:hypothetical protein
MNEVCDIWSSPWLDLQRRLAKEARSNSSALSRTPPASRDPTNWLGRALNRAALAEAR